MRRFARRSIWPAFEELPAVRVSHARQRHAERGHDVVDRYSTNDLRILRLDGRSGFQAGPTMATYYASKAFVNNFTEALSYELRGTGVTATVSCPGPLTTEFFQAAAAHPPRLLIPMTAEAVARGAYRSMRAGRPLMIHGLMNWLVAAAGSLTPRIIIVAFLVKPPSTPALKA